MRAALGLRAAIAVAVLILAAVAAYLVLGFADDDPDGQPGPTVGKAYIGDSLTALRLEANGNGWAPYAGPDAPEGAYLGVMNEGSDELSATVTLPDALPKGTHYASVKAIDYDRHATVRLAVGGGEAEVATDDRDPNGYWTKPAPLAVDSSSKRLTITVARRDTAPGPARLMLRGLYLTPDAGESVLADDQVIDLGYPTERDTSPPRPGNLVRGGSFETGVGHGWGLGGGRTVSVASTWDSERGAVGAASLKLPLDPGRGGAPAGGLVSTAYAVAPNKRHTLSAWVRTDSGNTARGSIRLVNSYDPATNGPLPAGQPAQPTVAKDFEVGAKWTRVDVTGFLLDYPSAEYSIAITADAQAGRHLWVDGISLNEGGPAPYAPRAPLEVGVTSGEPSALFYEDESATMRLRVSNATGARRAGAVRYEIYDYMNRRLKAGRHRVTVPARSTAARALDVDVGRRGSFRLVLWVDGQDGSEEEVLYGIVPRPQRAGADRGSSIGIHSNFHAFTYGAMARLGIKWDRALSPAAFFRWKDVEPRDDEYIWFDEPVGLARRRGVMALGVLGTNNYWPEWADREGLPDLDKWAEFVTQTATHYRGDVAAWEIWNEPLRIFKPEFYARMLKRGAEAVKRADPRATVVGMGGAASAEEVKAVIDAVERLYPQWPWRRDIDVLSIHMYPAGESLEQAGAGLGDTYRKLLGDYRKPLWNTETGTWDRGNFHTEQAPVARWGRQLLEFRTAAQYTDASQLAVERLARNFVESMGSGLSKYFYYDLRVIAAPTYYESHPTMLEYDDSIRPKGIAYAVLAKLFDHATGRGRAPVGDEDTRAYLFDRRGTALAALYSQGGGRKAVTLRRLPPGSLAAYDSMGNPVAARGNRVVYGRRPVYLEVEGVGAQRLRAALRAGSVTTVADTAAPNLTIDVGPRGPVPAAPVRLRWSAADDTATPSRLEPDALTYSHRLSGPGDRDDWSAWSAGNSVEYSDLAPGRYEFAVRARDRAGNESRVATRSIEVSPPK